MTYRCFERKEHSVLYQKYMIREPEEVHSLILSYLEAKKGKPFGLAVDIGCGTGVSTRVLVPHFQKLVGVDISETQLQEARRMGSLPNLSYLIAPAEQLPFEDGSVDLINASASANWFKVEEWLGEVDRVLKPSGCLALYSPEPYFDLHYADCSETLTAIFMEAFQFLVRDYGPERVYALMKDECKDIFDAIPFKDKKRVTKILLKRPMSLAALMGFTESLCMFQTYLSSDPEAATEFLQKLQNSLLETMGASSVDTELELQVNYFCVLACKPS